jgi:2-polyprenyl-6-hydroxyphenyl methylase / 3-demethylubiquinone-9 3-methyltransferase
MKVNNTIYETYGHKWWDDDAGFELSSLRYVANPCRYRYFKEVLHRVGCSGKKVLDVGCGGGFLAEEFAKDGFEVTGIDPAFNSLEAARKHAVQNGLAIDYQAGQGESLPFSDGCFDIIACCDVLEHVDDVDRVIKETSRCLAKGGIFLFDTVNRTLKSKLVLIKIWQDWGLVLAAEKNAHVWEKFIKPEELSTSLRMNGLEVREIKGLSPMKTPIAVLVTMLKIRKGLVHGAAIADELPLHISEDLSISYIGWALKEQPPGALSR